MGNKGKRQPDAPVPAGAYRVRAAIELFDVTKASEVMGFAKSEDVTTDAATALAVVVDEVLHHFGVELSRKDSATRAMVTIAQTVGILSREIPNGTPLHVNADQVVEQVRRAFAVLEDRAGTNSVATLLWELHELLRPFDGLDNAVANALPFRVQSLINALETARLAAGEQRVRDALVAIATHLRMVPPDASPGAPVTVDLDAVVDGVRWQAETVAEVLDALELSPDDHGAITVGDRVRKAVEAEHLLNHNRVPRTVGDLELAYGPRATELLKTFVTDLADRMGFAPGDLTREQVLAEIERRQSDRTDLHNRMFTLLQAVGLFDQYDDGGYEITRDARQAVVDRVREWKTRLDGLGKPVPDGLVSALDGLRKDADMSAESGALSTMAPWEAWNKMRDQVREHAKFVREATGALRLGPVSEMPPVLDELRGTVGFVDEAARLMGYQHDGDWSLTDLRKELTRRFDDADQVRAELRKLLDARGSDTIGNAAYYQKFLGDLADDLGLDSRLLSLDAVRGRVVAQRDELRKLRSMADQVALNLGLPRDATPTMIADRTAKFSAVYLGADLAAHEEFVRTACSDLGLTGVVELNDLRAKVKDLLSYRDFADDVRRHLGAPPDAYLGDVMETVSRMAAHSRECKAPRWQRTEGATVELFANLSEPPTDRVGNGNTDVVTSWLTRLRDAVKAEFAVLDFHLTYDVATAALDRAHESVMAQAPTVAIGKVLEVPSVTVASVPVSPSMVSRQAAAEAVFDAVALGFATFASELRDMADVPEQRGNHDGDTLRMVADLCDEMPGKLRAMMEAMNHPNGHYDRVLSLEADARIRSRALLDAVGRPSSDKPTAKRFYRAIDEVHALRSCVDELTTMLDCQPHEVAGRVELLNSRRAQFAMVDAAERLSDALGLQRGQVLYTDMLEMVRSRMAAWPSIVEVLGAYGSENDELPPSAVSAAVVEAQQYRQQFRAHLDEIGGHVGFGEVVSTPVQSRRLVEFVRVSARRWPDGAAADATIAVLTEDDVQVVANVLEKRTRESYPSVSLDWEALVHQVFLALHDRGLVDFPPSAAQRIVESTVTLPVTDPEATAMVSLADVVAERDRQAGS